MFSYNKIVHVYETDMMGIVHHSNYLRFCEEARVAWCVSKKLISTQIEDVFSLTVLETKVKHIKPSRYADNLKINVRVKTEGVRIIFQYQIFIKDEIVCAAETIHCELDLNFKVKRLKKQLVELVEKEIWTETWL